MYYPDFATFLSTVPFPVTPDEFVIGGYFSPGDGGGGTFVWVPISPPGSIAPPAEDLGIIFYHPSDTTPTPGYHGYFKRIFSGPINVRWFGARGDGIADDTVAVQAARNSQFCKEGGTLYFPKGVYVGAFEISHTQGEVNITGDGEGSVLQWDGISGTVLRLGYHSYHWRYSKVSNLTIDGLSRQADGVTFDENSSPELSGRWNFENVTFRNCDKGIHKPKGNIGNSYTNCLFSGNDYGYYAEGYYAMHAGCEIFNGCHIDDSSHAAIFVKGIYQYGQLIIDGTIIQGNQGFGIFIKGIGEAQATFTPVSIRNIWLEGNAVPLLSAELNQGQVVPPSGAFSATGHIDARYNPVTSTLIFSVNFGGLSGNPLGSSGFYTGASGTTGTALYTGGFPASPSGTWTGTLFLTPAQVADLYAGNFYVQIDTSGYPGGEIRGQLPATSNITIDGVTYTPSEWRTFQFEGVRSVFIENTQVIDMALVDSSVKLNGCRSDRRFVASNEWPYRIERNGNSQITADDLIYEKSLSEDIFVNSISYDGTADILGDHAAPTSVWGPLRTCIVSGINNLLLTSGMITEPVSHIWPGYAGTPDRYAVDNLKAGTMISYFSPSANNIAITCQDMTLQADDVVKSPDSFKVSSGYVFWSIHACQCGRSSVQGYFGTDPDPSHNANCKLGQVIFKQGQWVCSYGIKKLEFEDEQDMHLWFLGNDKGGTFRFCHYQVLVFGNLYDAQSYSNSRAFAIKGEICDKGLPDG